MKRFYLILIGISVFSCKKLEQEDFDLNITIDNTNYSIGDEIKINIEGGSNKALYYPVIVKYSDAAETSDLCEACMATGGFFCGNDQNNWTSYSPNGCVPNGLNDLFYLNDGYNDCVDGSDEVDGVISTENCDEYNNPNPGTLLISEKESLLTNTENYDQCCSYGGISDGYSELSTYLANGLICNCEIKGEMIYTISDDLEWDWDEWVVNPFYTGGNNFKILILDPFVGTSGRTEYPELREPNSQNVIAASNFFTIQE